MRCRSKSTFGRGEKIIIAFLCFGDDVNELGDPNDDGSSRLDSTHSNSGAEREKAPSSLTPKRRGRFSSVLTSVSIGWKEVLCGRWIITVFFYLVIVDLFDREAQE